MIAIRAHKNGAAQTGFDLGNDGYTPITWAAPGGTDSYMTGGEWHADAWKPIQPSGEARPVIFQGQLWIQSGGTGNPPNHVARIIKNGDMNKSLGAMFGTKVGYTDSWAIPLNMQDIAQPGDWYSIVLYVTNAAAVLDGHPLHTFWSGAVL